MGTSGCLSAAPTPCAAAAAAVAAGYQLRSSSAPMWHSQHAHGMYCLLTGSHSFCALSNLFLHVGQCAEHRAAACCSSCAKPGLLPCPGQFDLCPQSKGLVQRPGVIAVMSHNMQLRSCLEHTRMAQNSHTKPANRGLPAGQDTADSTHVKCQYTGSHVQLHDTTRLCMQLSQKCWQCVRFQRSAGSTAAKHRKPSTALKQCAAKCITVKASLTLHAQPEIRSARRAIAQRCAQATSHSLYRALTNTDTQPAA